MKALLLTVVSCVLVSEIVCPPVNPNPKPVEGDSPDEDPVRVRIFIYLFFLLICMQYLS